MTLYESALRSAFVDHHADFVAITSRREQSQIETVNYGIDKGWLQGEWDTRDEQSTAFVCRLTEAGRKHFGLEPKDLMTPCPTCMHPERYHDRIEGDDTHGCLICANEARIKRAVAEDRAKASRETNLPVSTKYLGRNRRELIVSKECERGSHRSCDGLHHRESECSEKSDARCPCTCHMPGSETKAGGDALEAARDYFNVADSPSLHNSPQVLRLAALIERRERAARVDALKDTLSYWHVEQDEPQCLWTDAVEAEIASLEGKPHA